MQVIDWTAPTADARDHWIIEPSFRVRVFRTGAWVVHAFVDRRVISIAQGATSEVCRSQAAVLIHEAARMQDRVHAQALRIVAAFIRELPQHWPGFRGGSEL